MDFYANATFPIINGSQAVCEGFGPYLRDESRMPGGRADALVFPRTENEMAAVLENAFQSGTPITLSGGRTGIVGGAVPFGGLLMSLDQFDRFLGVRWDDKRQSWTVRIQPGMRIETLEALIQKRIAPESVAADDALDNKESKRFFSSSSNWFYPPDPTEKTAQAGGTVATNASGSHSFRFGQTRNFVRGLHVVLSDGTVLTLSREGETRSIGERFRIIGKNGEAEVPVPNYFQPSVKNVAGYFSRNSLNFMDLFVGSEGTLGAISEIELELAPKPSSLFGGIAFFPSETDAVSFVRSIRNDRRCHPWILEYFDGHSLTLLGSSSESFPTMPNQSGAAVCFEQACLPQELDALIAAYDALLSENGSDLNRTWGATDETELARLTRFRHALPETVNRLIGQRQQEIPELSKIGTDFAVQDKDLERVFRLYRSKLDPTGMEYVVFGHIGENHVHVNMLPKDRDELHKAKSIYLELAREIVAWGGTVSAEHGIGKLKKHLLPIMFRPEHIEEMKAIKRALDPKWILGKDTLF